MQCFSNTTTVAFLLSSVHTVHTVCSGGGFTTHDWTSLAFLIIRSHLATRARPLLKGDQPWSTIPSSTAMWPFWMWLGTLATYREENLPWRWGPWSRPSRSFSSIPPVEGLPSPSPWRWGQQCPWQPGRNAGNEITGRERRGTKGMNGAKDSVMSLTSPICFIATQFTSFSAHPPPSPR